ncbi:HU family DNA-binding protein [Sporomusa aerivorans]|uniref:HU family DNA-binding protein n=1 Tax=Sporomusa aerivorans TaxID=204936 RepID=UPI00352AA243
MTKLEIVDEIAYRTESTKVAAEKFYSTLLEIVTEELAIGNDVIFKGFGTFSVVDAPERTARNPQNGQSVTVEAKRKPKFKASKVLKKAVCEKNKRRKK